MWGKTQKHRLTRGAGSTAVADDVNLFGNRLEGLCDTADLLGALGIKVDKEVVVPLGSLGGATVSCETCEKKEKRRWSEQPRNTRV